MTQLVLVYVIIAIATIYTVYSIIKTLRVKSKDGCGGDCACSVKDEFRKALKKSSKQDLHMVK